MTSQSFIPIHNDVPIPTDCDNAVFLEIHLDKLFYVGDNVTLHQVVEKTDNELVIKGDYKVFWDPDQCINFITSLDWRKVFLTLTDDFIYLLPMIHDLPQIVYIYIYSESPESVLYSKTDYPKLRAIVRATSPNANDPLLKDIEMFRRDLMPINVNNPIQLKTKLLIREPLIIEEYLALWIADTSDSQRFDTTPITNIIKRLDFCFDINHCINIIKSLPDNTEIFLISSHSDMETLLKEVVTLTNVIAIYLFDYDQSLNVNFNDSVTKCHGRFQDIESLSIQLYHDYKNAKHTASLTISVFDREQNQKTVRDLSKESVRFLWFQMLIDILIRTPHNEQSKDEMLHECRQYYKDNATRLKQIDEFDKIYKSNEALMFYTNDSFVYRLFNQALRTENIDVIFIFRFFLSDMYNHLQNLYSQQFAINSTCENDKLNVYRGQKMTATEFDHIKNNVGRLISIGVFFSTTKNRNYAVIYSGSDDRNREPGSLSVIFEIVVNLNHDVRKRPFASLEHLSQFPDEEEILFSVGSTFRILNIHDKQASDGYWLVEMVTIDQDSDLDELNCQLNQEYSRNGNLCDLGEALIGMCDYERAERYFQMLLEYTPYFNPSFGIIHGCLGIIFANKGNYQKALEYQEKALEYWTRNSLDGSNQHRISNAYIHIGAAYRHLGQLDSALKYLLMAADLEKSTGSLSFAYNELAITYRDKGDNSLALEYFLKTLNIDENVLKLTKYHPSLATIYNNIGEIYTKLEKYDDALTYLERALEIRLKGTVSTHTDLAAIYHNLGSIYDRNKQFTKALDVYHKALDIDSRTLHADHESLASSHNAIACTYLHLKDFSKALYHAENALRILLRSQAKENLLLVSAYQYNLGCIQHGLGNSKKALAMAEKTLRNQLASGSENQHELANIYNLFSEIYEKEEDISKALEYSEKSIEQEKIWALRNHTCQLDRFLPRLEHLKNCSLKNINQCSVSFTSNKIQLEHTNMQDDMIPNLEKDLQQASESNIEQRLYLLGSLITAHSIDKNYSTAMKYIDEAQTIYKEHQMSNLITKQQLENSMITVFFNAARCYHRQQNWKKCLNILTKSLDLALKQTEEPDLLPEIYYCMASTYIHQQDIHMAISHYELAIEAGRRRLADDHPDMQRYQFQLQMLKNALSQAYNRGTQ